jgi:hypothetical protein
MSPGLQRGLRVFLGALIHGVPAMANLQRAPAARNRCLRGDRPKCYPALARPVLPTHLPG